MKKDNIVWHNVVTITSNLILYWKPVVWGMVSERW